MPLAIRHRARQLRDLVRRDGVARTLVKVWQRMRHGPGQWAKADILAHFDYVGLPPIRVGAPDADRCDLLWLIPDFNIGSGGHLNIFRLIWNLEARGYRSGIVIVQAGHHATAEAAAKDISAHFFPLKARVYLGVENLPASEFLVATSWQTAYYAKAFEGPARKIYFVQDFEPYFYAMGTESVLAENTYRFGFFAITAGDWLARLLRANYGMRTHPVGFGVEGERYRKVHRRQPDTKHVFFYARPPTPRRAFELGVMVLNEVSRRRPDTRFILAGWDVAGFHLPFAHLNCGTVALDELPDLYSQCDVALVLSLTNLSLLPLELMACGCAVVSNRGENVEWLLDDSCVCLSDATVDDLATAVCGLLADDGRRAALSERGERFAHQQSWEMVTTQFEAGLRSAREAP